MSDKSSERARSRSSARRNRFWRNLVADPVRKLLALALAILLWIFLDSQITDEKGMQLKLIGERSAREAVRSEIVDSHIVVHPPSGWRVIGFRNHVTTEAITAVEVTFQAPQHQLARLMANPGLEVRPRPDELNLRTSTITFDLQSLQAQDYDVLKAIHEMTPRRVDVVLERVEEKAITLDRTHVRVIYPDSKEFPDFPERLRMDAAMFAPQQVTVQGPKSLTDVRGVTLFTLDLSGLGSFPDPKIVTGLNPEPPGNVTIQGGPVTVTIPLDPSFEEFELNVPVQVDTEGRADPRTRDFEHDPTVPVTLSASGELAAVLSRMTDAELDEWVRRNARVLVLLFDDTWRGERQSMAANFWVLDPRYERGRHYYTKFAPAVVVRPKQKN